MRAGRVLVLVGSVVTVAGLVLGLVALLPLVSSAEMSPLFWGLAMLLGLGLTVIGIGLFAGGRERSRIQRSAPGTAGTSQAIP